MTSKKKKKKKKSKMLKVKEGFKAAGCQVQMQHPLLQIRSFQITGACRKSFTSIFANSLTSMPFTTVNKISFSIIAFINMTIVILVLFRASDRIQKN